MKKQCEHFLALRPEKVANFIRKTQIRCSSHKHVSSEYNLCLNCGETRCDTSAELKCSEQHSQANRHYVVLKLLSMQIYCFCCEKYVDEEGIQMEVSRAERKKLEKALQLRQKIMALAEKYLSFEKLEKKKKQTIKKTEQTMQGEKMPRTKSVIKKDHEARLFGLANIGNTCYFNSVLQCLYATAQVHHLYSEVEFKDDINQVFRKFLKNTEKVYCPKNLFSLICKTHKAFRGMEQQDAFELYVFLLNSLIQSTEKKGEKGQPNISNIFGFTIASRLTCLNCGNISWNKDFSLGLSIPIVKKNIKKIEQIPGGEAVPEEQIGEDGLYLPTFQSTGTFLDNFFDPQLFTKENSYVCEECESSGAVQKFYMRDAPKVLTINFKRFTNTGSKLNSRVAIAQKLSLKNILLRKQSCQYEIYAAIVHSGGSSGGHYVAYTKRNDEWFYFSDTHVKPGGSFKTTQPYVVFYKKIEEEEKKEQIEDSFREESEQNQSKSELMKKQRAHSQQNETLSDQEEGQ